MQTENTLLKKQTEIKARAFDRLIEHLDQNKDVQNIDLMILAKFCRNCLSKWLVAEAAELAVDLDMGQARRMVYKMDYAKWKDLYQPEATPKQLSEYQARMKPD